LSVPIYTDGPGKATGINAGGEVVNWYTHSEATSLNDRGVIVGVVQTGERAVRAYMLVPRA
jgi:hypothetical protein